ncbi:MAG: DUF3179 domain-containing protein [Chloroflexi bacterium]|nr:DUF3179 domain-containing protein [Chloroflexota bacterium]
MGIVLFALIVGACALVLPTGDSAPERSSLAIPSTSDEADFSPAPVESSPGAEELLSPDEPPPAGAEEEFTTDFTRHTVSYREILSGGPPKDGIPAIDEPRFVGVEEADAWLEPREPVILLQVGDDVRAYPIQILIWHEIVNDRVGNVPVVVTFCPLCNTAIAFERMVGGRALDFGTTGRLRFSNLIMYDRQTESWWQQASGEAVAGDFAGRRLMPLPAAIVSWADFKTVYPDGKVLSRETGYRRSYGRNPYVGYDDVDQSPFLYDGPETPGVLPAMARVVTVDLNGEAVAYPYDILQRVHVVNDVVGGIPIVVFWAPGIASPLDVGAVAQGRDVGTANVFSRKLEGEVFTFRYDGQRVIDDQTNSEWNVLGRAVGGKLAGKQLTPVVNINHFWFSWAAFRPDTRVYRP